MLRNTFERYCIIRRALLNDTLYEKWFELQLRVAQWQRERENTNISLAPREKGGIPFIPFIPFLHSVEKISWSNLRYVLRKSNVKRSHPGYWTLSASRGNPLFPDFRIGQNDGREATKGSGVFKPLENRGGEETGECKKACAPRFFGTGGEKRKGMEGARVRTHLPRILRKRDFIRASSSLPPRFLSKLGRSEFVAGIKRDRSSYSQVSIFCVVYL